MKKLGASEVSAVGLGCMELSHAYGTPPSEGLGQQVLETALELGVVHFDTASLYGFGRNEHLLGKSLKAHRESIFLASKCGMKGVDGKRLIDGRPEALAKDIDESLTRLQTDVIDLYYLHRWDKRVPIEDSIGAMKDMVSAGKVKAIGLSEVSSETLLKAHKVHPIAAVQSEYSLWSRNVELGVLSACESIGAALVAFSPLARGFFTDVAINPEEFTENDIRRGMPRFHQEHLENNAELLKQFLSIAVEVGCPPSQLALAWLLHQGDHVHVIPGTTNLKHLTSNVGALGVRLGTEILERLDKIADPENISGPRYNAATQSEIDTEDFAPSERANT